MAGLKAIYRRRSALATLQKRQACHAVALAKAGLLGSEILQRARQVGGRSPMVELGAQRLGDDGAGEEEGGGHVR